MPVISLDEDCEDLTLTAVAEYAAPVARVWRMWADPRLLERWWAAPGCAAAFDRYEFAVGGACRYRLTGPGGTVAHGWWRVCAVDEPRRLEFEDGSADTEVDGDTASDSTHTSVVIEPAGAGARMTVQNTFSFVEQQEQHAAIGGPARLRGSLEQIDALLAE